MNRKYTTGEFAELVGFIRESVPNVAIGTDLIVGFPGESDEHFQNTFKFLEKMQFDVVYMAIYSPEEEYFIPELLMCSDAMYAGLDVLKPHIRINNKVGKHRVVIGVVEGDTHDIGKNLVKIMLESAGFEVFDLGRDIPPIRFVEKAEEVNAKIIALSTLMTTTMDGMAEVINILNRQKIRDRYKVMVGGGPISQRFADKIGADGYSANAAEAVRLARRLVGGADCAS